MRQESWKRDLTHLEKHCPTPQKTNKKSRITKVKLKMYIKKRGNKKSRKQKAHPFAVSCLHQSCRREEAVATARMRMQFEQDPTRSLTARQLDLDVIRGGIREDPVAHESEGGYLLRRDDLPSPPFLLLLVLLGLGADLGVLFLEGRRGGGVVGWYHGWCESRRARVEGYGLGICSICRRGEARTLMGRDEGSQSVRTQERGREGEAGDLAVWQSGHCVEAWGKLMGASRLECGVETFRGEEWRGLWNLNPASQILCNSTVESAVWLRRPLQIKHRLNRGNICTAGELPQQNRIPNLDFLFVWFHEAGRVIFFLKKILLRN